MRYALVAAALLALVTLLDPGAASAQSEPARAPSAAHLRRQARAAMREGRLGVAYSQFLRAADGSNDPGAWLELAEAADRLRMDERAVEAYGRYLALREAAPDRAEIEARVRVLRQVLEGGRFVEADDGNTVRLIHDWNGEPSLPNPPTAAAGRSGAHVLVDWAGRPLAGRRTRDMLALADWDGVIRGATPSSPDTPEPPTDQGLGRVLSTP